MKRFGTILCTLVLLCALVACGDKTPDSTTASSGDTEQTTVVTEEALGVPETADYGGEAFNILSAGSVAYNDFNFDEESSLALDNAQYKRKRLVEEKYKVEISEVIKQAYSSGGGPGFMQINTDVSAGDCNYDLALIAGYDVSVLAYSGLLYDLNSMPGIDLTKSWWDQKANESLAVNGVMFFTTGEITCSDNNAAFVILFNKGLLKDYELENPYTLVYDGAWTMDKFAELCKTVTEDLDQNGTMDKNDRFGLLVWDDSVVGIVNAAGQRCCTINEDGNIELTLYNETTVSALEKYFSIAYDTQYAYTYQRVSGYNEQELWSGNHGLFWTTWLGIVPRYREMENDFGILPYPKLTEAQTDYYSCLAPWNSQFVCVPVIQEDIDRTGVLLEALGYYGQKTVLPAYYDVNLVGQSSRDEESEAMLDIIFGNVVYDIGYIYRIGPYNKELIYMLRAGDTSFTSRYDSLLGRAESSLKTINTAYSMAVADWQK